MDSELLPPPGCYESLKTQRGRYSHDFGLQYSFIAVILVCICALEGKILSFIFTIVGFVLWQMPGIYRKGHCLTALGWLISSWKDDFCHKWVILESQLEGEVSSLVPQKETELGWASQLRLNVNGKLWGNVMVWWWFRIIYLNCPE